jgi:acetoin utilization deacetylase AcuC-like enzyme
VTDWRSLAANHQSPIKHQSAITNPQLRVSRLSLYTSDRFADHLTPPGHPERVERAEVMQVVASEWRQRGGAVIEPTPAMEEQLTRIHDVEYVSLIRETAGRAVALDPDTVTSPESYDIACLAAGTACGAVDAVLDGQTTRGLALVRPPGHHAERGRAMGFCLFNNIAVAAAHARARGAHRVAIVDYDVHHGNGTQDSFYADPSVLFVSSHQFPFYPGTGAAGETGRGAGEGFTVNLPLDAGATDADYERVYEGVAFPILRQFKPDLILLSAGFDAHERDPLAGMRLTTSQFERMTAALAAVADEVCEGRLVAVTEGGYDLHALAGCLRASVRALAGETSIADLPAPEGPSPRGDATLVQVLPIVRNYWKI